MYDCSSPEGTWVELPSSLLPRDVYAQKTPEKLSIKCHNIHSAAIAGGREREGERGERDREGGREGGREGDRRGVR